jgi:hypothetical protein
MKIQILSAILFSAMLAHAGEASKEIPFSSKKEVEVEPGAEKLIVIRAQPELVRFLETGVMTAQASVAFQILAKDQNNQGKSLERMAIDAIKANNKSAAEATLKNTK